MLKGSLIKGSLEYIWARIQQASQNHSQNRAERFDKGKKKKKVLPQSRTWGAFEVTFNRKYKFQICGFTTLGICFNEKVFLWLLLVRAHSEEGDRDHLMQE